MSAKGPSKCPVLRAPGDLMFAPALEYWEARRLGPRRTAPCHEHARRLQPYSPRRKGRPVAGAAFGRVKPPVVSAHWAYSIALGQAKATPPICCVVTLPATSGASLTHPEIIGRVREVCDGTHVQVMLYSRGGIRPRA